MNAGELVISLLLKAGSFKAEVEKVQHKLDEIPKHVTDLEKAFDKAVEDGKKIAQVTEEYKKLREELIRTGASKEKLDALDAAAKRFGVNVEEVTGKAKNGFQGLMPTLTKVAGILGVGFSIKSAISTYLDQADALGKYSDSLGVAVEDVQAWEEAVKHAGGTGEGFRQSLQGLTANLTAIATTGKGRMLPFLQELGISARDANGKVKDAMQLLPELAEKFEKMAPAEAAGFGEKLGLDKGLVMLLQQGKKATEEAVKAGKEHIRFTKADAEAAAKANDAIQDMQTSLTALIYRAVAPAIPLMTLFANIIHKAAQWISENSEVVTAFFMAVGSILMGRATPAMLKFVKATWAAKAALLPFLKIGAIVTALGLAFDDLWAFITGGDSVIERFAKRLGFSQEQIEGVRNALRNVIGFFLDLWDAVTGQGADATAAWNRVKATWEAMKNWFKGMVDTIKGWLLDLLPDWLRKMISDDATSQKGAETHAAAKAGDAGAQAAYMQNYDAWGTPLAAMAKPGDMGAGGARVDNSRHVDQKTNINTLNVYSKAADAEGIADDIYGELSNRTAQMDGAY